MLGINENDKAMVVYFCEKGEGVPTYFEHIPLSQKTLREVNYSQDVHTTIESYQKSCDIQHLQQMFELIVVAGEGVGAWFANYFAHQYNLRTLLINPDINSKDELSFSISNSQSVAVLIELNQAKYTKEVYENFFNQVPQNWSIEYKQGDCYGVTQDLQTAVIDLCDCGWAWIDDGVWHGEE